MKASWSSGKDTDTLRRLATESLFHDCTLRRHHGGCSPRSNQRRWFESGTRYFFCVIFVLFMVQVKRTLCFSSHLRRGSAMLSILAFAQSSSYWKYEGFAIGRRQASR